ncbi:MAG: hypothetical protein WB789_04270 [Thermoplasmata archaeon]
MRRLGLHRLSLGAVVGAVLALLLVIGPLVPAWDGSSGAHSAITGASARPAATDFSATVTFQGTPVADHTTAGTAITASLANPFATVFNWNSPGQATLVTKGALTILFLGASVGTTVQTITGAVPSTTGSINMNDTDFSQDQYLFEGVYQVEASLFDHGTAIWNSTFYVWIQASDHLTVINIALILIGILEIYQIAALGSVRVARKQMGIDTPPKQGGT